jgi:hypothetical protein
MRKSREVNLTELYWNGSQQILHYYHGYKCSIDILPRSITRDLSEIIEKPSELAMDHTIWLLERFGVYSPNLRDQLQENQQKLLTSKYDLYRRPPAI